jgi:hypothetical protein
MGFFDVIGWTPQWQSGDSAFEAHAERLRGLAGRVVVDVCGVFDVGDDRWVPSFPIVVAFADGTQLEVCWQRFNELAISWNSIRIDTEPVRGDEWTLQWRSISVANFDAALVRGERIAQVTCAETLLRWSGSTADSSATWLIAGIYLRVQNRRGIHIFNALDENGIDHHPVEEEDYRIKEITTT